MKLSVIVVKYNCDKYLGSCLKSIGSDEDSDKDFECECIVIDNDENNVGYGAGCNIGAKKAKGKYLLFLNPDTVVLPRSLQKMVDFMEGRPKVSVLGPKIYKNFRKEKQLSFCRFPDPLTAFFVFSPLQKIWPNNPFFSRYVYDENKKDNGILEVGAVAGAAILVRRDIFEAVGGFDEKFFLYFEENDLCWRIKNYGGRIVYYPEAEIVHFGGKSTVDLRKADKYFRQSRALFLRKSYGRLIGLLVESLIKLAGG